MHLITDKFSTSFKCSTLVNRQVNDKTHILLLVANFSSKFRPV